MHKAVFLTINVIYKWKKMYITGVRLYWDMKEVSLVIKAVPRSV